ncbi:MAG: 23S rRNA (adenine(2503)-C(2))-methyltransferase RlmN [Lachnospiraceae bacterium]|nr:23S rRNA (adenine(2503)-C(2))-methyltransferase RlmN [Lachnospiraceae bacterium]
MEKKDIKSMSEAEIASELAALGERRFRAGQIYSWLHQKRVTSFEAMTNLSRPLRQELAERYRIPQMTTAGCRVSRDDGTRKYAFALEDGNIIESVFMRYRHGNSVCVSSQVGCRMGCRFCASTLDGLERNLAPSEMLEQVYQIQRDVGERVSHVVVMGTGEPLDNLANLVRFIRILSDEEAGGISQRNITVSTCGLVPRIGELAAEKLQITLALSLHAPNDVLRRTMMPIASTYSVAQCLEACEAYFRATGRRVSYEYSLVEGVNDGREQAEELAGLLHGKNCHVNLIPVNPIEERSFRESRPANVANFKKILEKRGINVTIRRSMGADIDSACGQLRRKIVRQREQRGGIS